MRGAAATMGDFYFAGAGPTSDQTARSAAAPSSATSDPNGVNTMGALQASPGTTPKLDRTPILPFLQANPIWVLPIGLGGLVLIKLLREWGGKAGDFHVFKADGYWFVMTVGAGLVGIPIAKAIANKYAPQPVRDYLNNA